MYFYNYLASNLPLFSASLVIIFIAIKNFNVRRKESLYFLSFTTIVLILSVIVAMESHSMAHGEIVASTVFTSLGYILRPILLYIFILLANMDQKRARRFYIVLFVPLVLNLIVYSFPWFFGVPGLSTIVYSYQLAADGTAEFIRGSVLNFFSHSVCVLYLVMLVYVSTIRFAGKHRRDGIVIILCVFIIVSTVVTETITGRNDLLNII